MAGYRRQDAAARVKPNHPRLMSGHTAQLVAAGSDDGHGPGCKKRLMKNLSLIAVLVSLGRPAVAAGDAAKGEADFKKCVSCHMIVAPDGTVVQPGGKVGRPVTSLPDFKYGDSFRAVAAKGMVWNEDLLAAYVTDAAAWLKEQTGDPTARARMAFKLKEGGADVAAYLATIKQTAPSAPPPGRARCVFRYRLQSRRPAPVPVLQPVPRSSHAPRSTADGRGAARFRQRCPSPA